MANSKNQRMAGEVWQNYQIESFGSNDLAKLRADGLTNNDILKVAAASKYVEPEMDQQLRKLNNESIDFNKIPSKVQKQLLQRGEIGSDFIFLGGNPNDDKNYRAGNSPTKTRTATTKGGGYGEGEYQAPTQWIDNEATRNMPRGDRSEMLRWEGMNADGTANALRGTRIEPDRDGDKSYLKTRDTTWAVPNDYLPRSTPAPAAKAPDAPQQQGQQGQSAPPAPPLNERFDPTKYMLNTPSTATPSSTASSSSADDENRKMRYGYNFDNSGGLELGGFEKYIGGYQKYLDGLPRNLA